MLDKNISKNSVLEKYAKVIGIILAVTLIGAGITYQNQVTTGHGHEHSSELNLGENSSGYFTCAMHPTVRRDAAGNCPICGMELVFVGGEETETSETHQQHSGAGHDKGQPSLASLIEDDAVASENIDYYTCGMHPSVKAHEPGKCPICSMDLVPVYKDGSSGKKDPQVFSTIKISAGSESDAFTLKTERAQKMSLHKAINASGKFTVADDRLAIISARTGGRIEKLFINYIGATVKKNQPLMTIYSPELVTTQQDFVDALIAHEAAASSQFISIKDNAKDLLEATKERLKLWGVADKQIRELSRTKKVKTAVEILSPVNGVVLKKTAVEGRYFKEGQEFFEIGDLTTVWLYADVYEYEIPWIEKNLTVVASSAAMGAKKVTGEITFIEPTLNPKTRTLRIRAEFDNKDLKIKPESYATVSILVKTPADIIAVPKSSVIDTGVRKIVYIQEDKNTFNGILVSTGIEAEGYVQILSGLEGNEKVVTQAAFLLDSQSQLGGGQEGLYGNAIEVKDKDTKSDTKN